MSNANCQLSSELKRREKEAKKFSNNLGEPAGSSLGIVRKTQQVQWAISTLQIIVRLLHQGEVRTFLVKLCLMPIGTIKNALS